MMPTVTLLVVFISNMAGTSQYTVAKFNDPKTCEIARATYVEMTVRNDTKYVCIEGVLHQ